MSAQKLTLYHEKVKMASPSLLLPCSFITQPERKEIQRRECKLKCLRDQAGNKQTSEARNKLGAVGCGRHWGAQAKSKEDRQCSVSVFCSPREIPAWQVVPGVHCTPFVAPFTS